MDKSRSKYFSIYTPLGTMDAKLHMEKEWLHWSFRRYQLCSKYSCELRWSIQYVVPQFFEEALSSGELDQLSNAQWWRFYEWRKNYQYVSHGMLIVTSFVCHYRINVMVIAFHELFFQCLCSSRPLKSPRRSPS
jgi:hypothetical protein